MKIAILGHMGRDEALVERLDLEHEVHVIGAWRNPGLEEKSIASGGSMTIVSNITEVREIGEVVSSISPDMFITNFDDSLAAGVIEEIRARLPDILLPCADKATSQIEWDKFLLRGILDEINPAYNPMNFMAVNSDEAEEAIANFEALGQEIVLKPRNLTGGKGVKVMGKHFNSFSEAREYASSVLQDEGQNGLEVQEKLLGQEFTLQIFTDGKTIVKPPATYDYPYREDGDTGPGTGGMGTFSMEDGLMPFITEKDYDEAIGLSEKILMKLDERDLSYKGVFYPSFFKTSNGLKVVEVNARGGDPELINILDLVEDDVDIADVLKKISQGELEATDIRYKKMASAMIYLVAPDYGYIKGPQIEYSMVPENIYGLGCRVRFAASECVNRGVFRTIGSSRTVGLSAVAGTAPEARQQILDAIEQGFQKPLNLSYRMDVARKGYIDRLIV